MLLKIMNIKINFNNLFLLRIIGILKDCNIWMRVNLDWRTADRNKHISQIILFCA